MRSEQSQVREAPRAAGIAHHKRLDVQGLRAVAVLLVVVYHSGLPLQGGFVGVDVFFVISGYVITSLLYREITRTDGISLVDFYTRRVRRILPALAVVVLFTVGLSALLQSPFGAQQATAGTAVAASLWVANWQILISSGSYFAEAAETNPLLHTWSLAVEEQFYLIFPSLMLVGWLWAMRRGRRRRLTLLVMLVAVVALSFAASWILSYGTPFEVARGGELAFYGSPMRAWEFAVGAIIAVAVTRRSALSDRTMATIGWGGLGVVLLGALVINAQMPFPGVAALVPALGTAAAIYAGSGRVRGPVGPLESRPMVWLGDLSYSWYLWHWPLIVFAALAFPENGWALALAGFGALLPAWLSYRFVETPIRFSGWRGVKVLVLAGLCISIPVASALALGVHARSLAGDETGSVEDLASGPQEAIDTGGDLLRAAAVAAEPPWDYYGEPCLQGGPNAPLDECIFGPADGPSLVLVGDSHASAYSPGVLAAGLPQGYRVHVIPTNQCPFADVELVRDGETNEECQTRVAQTYETLTADPPDVLLLANRSPNYVSAGQGVDGSFRKGRPCVPAAGNSECADPDAAVRIWVEGLRSLLEPLQRRGTAVALLQTVPEHVHGLSGCVTGDEVDLECLTTSRDLVDARRDVLVAEAALMDELGGATLDPVDRFCGPNLCKQYDGQRFNYRDASHLSREASEALAGPIGEVIARVER